MREMDQDGCLVDQEADTHEASQRKLVAYIANPGITPDQAIYQTQDGSLIDNKGNRYRFGPDNTIIPEPEANTHEASQNWQHTYEESGISITAGKGGILETWVIEPQADTPVVFAPTGEATISLPAPSMGVRYFIAQVGNQKIDPPVEIKNGQPVRASTQPEADTPIVTEAKE